MNLVGIARTWTVRAAFAMGRLLPIRQQVLLATAHSDHLDGNLARIREELARRQPAARVIQLAYVSRPGLRGALAVLLGSLRAGFRLATSRVVVLDDYFFPLYVVRPRRGTTVLQVWHACGAFKKFGYSLGSKSYGGPLARSGEVRIHSNYDVCLASSRRAAESYAEAFGQPLERFVWWLGVPKTDALVRLSASPEERQRLRRKLALPADGRVLLYAPTFRGEHTYSAQSPAILDVPLLRQTLPHDILLLRPHPFVRQRPSLVPDDALTVDVSGHPDVSELMLVSDVLITDFSSLIFDFSLLGRPIVFLAPDHDAYDEQRGFYFDYRREGPGPAFQTTEELGAYLRAGDFDLARVARFRDEWFEVADGHATERVVEQLVLPALRAEPDASPGSA